MITIGYLNYIENGLRLLCVIETYKTLFRKSITTGGLIGELINSITLVESVDQLMKFSQESLFN